MRPSPRTERRAPGRIMVTVPGDHFGPIPPEANPRGQVRCAPDQAPCA